MQDIASDANESREGERSKQGRRRQEQFEVAARHLRIAADVCRGPCLTWSVGDGWTATGARYRKGLPISSSIAESAVNLLVSHRMAKKQQMRWTNEGAHHLVQVRVAALNGELTPKRLAALSKLRCENAPQHRQVA